MLPFSTNIAYIEIENGSLFGELDLVVAARDNNLPINDYICSMVVKHHFMVRQFTVQAI